jgi:hypothetical protein
MKKLLFILLAYNLVFSCKEKDEEMLDNIQYQMAQDSSLTDTLNKKDVGYGVLVLDSSCFINVRDEYTGYKVYCYNLSINIEKEVQNKRDLVPTNFVVNSFSNYRWYFNPKSVSKDYVEKIGNTEVFIPDNVNELGLFHHYRIPADVDRSKEHSISFVFNNDLKVKEFDLKFNLTPVAQMEEYIYKYAIENDYTAKDVRNFYSFNIKVKTPESEYKIFYNLEIDIDKWGYSDIANTEQNFMPWRQKIEEINEDQFLDITIPVDFYMFDDDSTSEITNLKNLNQTNYQEMINQLNDLYAQKGQFTSSDPNSIDSKIKFELGKIVKVNHTPAYISINDYKDNWEARDYVFKKISSKMSTNEEHKRLSVFLAVGKDGEGTFPGTAPFPHSMEKEYTYYNRLNTPFAYSPQGDAGKPLLDMHPFPETWDYNKKFLDVYLNFDSNDNFVSDNYRSFCLYLGHEIGHHLGLYHSFDKEDFVTDAQESKTESNNIMSYSNNAVVITKQQAKRMQKICILDAMHAYNPYSKILSSEIFRVSEFVKKK